MRPTDNDPKGNDPIDRDPTNEEIVDHLQRGLVMRMHFCPLIGKRVGKKLTTFEFRTKFDGAEYRFEGMWLDGTETKVLAGLINKEYSRGKAISSLIDDKCFPSVEAWVVACRNALGDNIDTFPLAGCIFVDGQCVDELIDAADAAAAALAAEKTEDQEPAADDNESDPTDEQPADSQVSLQYMHFFCEQKQPTLLQQHRKLQTVSS